MKINDDDSVESALNLIPRFESILSKRLACVLNEASNIFPSESELVKYKYQEVQFILERSNRYETVYKTEVAKNLFGALFGVKEKVLYRERSGYLYYARVKTCEGGEWIGREKYAIDGDSLVSLEEFVAEEIMPDFGSQGWTVVGRKRTYGENNRGFIYYLKKEIKRESIMKY